MCHYCSRCGLYPRGIQSTDSNGRELALGQLENAECRVLDVPRSASMTEPTPGFDSNSHPVIVSSSSSSAAAASMASVCACNVGACSVGMRTRVCGSGSSDLESFPLAAVPGGLASLAVKYPVRNIFYLFALIRDLLDAMLMARSTLCQLPMTVAIAADTCCQHSQLVWIRP